MPQMLAAFCTGKEKIEVREVPAPSPAAGEVLLRVRACGICGSDLHFYRGDFPAIASVSPGHEFAGEVVEVGEGVDGFSPGQRVAIEPLRTCRECAYCRSGQYQLCPRRVQLGTIAPGGLAQYVCVPVYTLYPLADGFDFELGALVEPLAVAVHGLHIVDASGERVVVLGSGSIGLMAVLAARAAGAAEVVSTYRHQHQAEAALAAGAARVVEASEAAGLKRDRAGIVIETVGGHAETLDQAVGIVRAGGQVAVLGLFTQALRLNALALMLKEVRIAGCIYYCRPGERSDFEVALGILQADPERARRLITHRFPLERTAEAFTAALDKSSGSLKVQLTP